MNADKIISDLKKQIYHPVYWLEGEENFYIDQVIDFAEHQLLPPTEAEFNLTVFYGRDAVWTEVINACRRYPMFAEKQVVIIKEAQSMKDIDMLEGYVDKPLYSTLLFVGYKEKKLDGRKKLAKLLKEKAVFYSTRKMYDNLLPEWTADLVHKKGFTITKKGLLLLIDHIGNDLNRLNNEINKLELNMGDKKRISEDDIEQYIGVSKDFNVFELQKAIGERDLYKAIRIVRYFEANPKAAPLPLLFPSIYNYFSKIQLVQASGSKDENIVSTAAGINKYVIKEYISASSKFSTQELERNILLLHQYNLRSIGINSLNTPPAELLKEMVVKMIAA